MLIHLFVFFNMSCKGEKKDCYGDDSQSSVQMIYQYALPADNINYFTNIDSSFRRLNYTMMYMGSSFSYNQDLIECYKANDLNFILVTCLDINDSITTVKTKNIIANHNELNFVLNYGNMSVVNALAPLSIVQVEAEQIELLYDKSYESKLMGLLTQEVQTHKNFIENYYKLIEQPQNIFYICIEKNVQKLEGFIQKNDVVN